MISFWKWISEKRRHLGEGIVLLSSLFLSQEAQAINYFGRIVLGNYLSSENFTSPIAGSTSNNAIDFSGRLYLKVYNISSEDFETVMDLRDKYDLFDKLDQQNLLLTPGNTIKRTR